MLLFVQELKKNTTKVEITKKKKREREANPQAMDPIEFEDNRKIENKLRAETSRRKKIKIMEKSRVPAGNVSNNLTLSR